MLSAMASIIQLQGVAKSFKGGVVAVRHMDLAIEEGEFVTLLGPSGCGKTTTLRMIAGFESPDRGRVLIGGEDVTDLPPYKRQVNTVFQDYALFPHMDVGSNVGYGLKVSGVPKGEIDERVADALSMVGLLEKRRERPGNLSGGQKQRVALARALVRHPKVLLLDEPLSALDAKLREDMQVELKRLHERLGLTFVLVTHDQTEALVMSDRIIVMEQGEIVQSGSPTELYERPRTPYVADFIGTSNLMSGRLVAQDGGEALVALDAGQVRSRSVPGGLSAGDAVTVCVRPEKALLAANGGAQAEASLKGVLRESYFHGNSLRLAVDVAAGTPFLIDLQLTANTAQSDLPALGSEVTIALDPDNVILFEGAPA